MCKAVQRNLCISHLTGVYIPDSNDVATSASAMYTNPISTPEGATTNTTNPSVAAASAQTSEFFNTGQLLSIGRRHRS